MRYRSLGEHASCSHDVENRNGVMFWSDVLVMGTMRAGPFIATVVVLTLSPSEGRAQNTPASAVHASDAGAANSQAVVRPIAPTGDADDRLQKWMKSVRPLQNRLIEDDRLRSVESAVGLGIAAYEASRAHRRVPLGLIGTEALRLGFHQQLAVIRRQSGLTVEPSIGRGGFAITFHKTLD
jgi:hypothetical protein